MEGGDVLKKGELEDPMETEKPEAGANKEGNTKKKKSKKGKNKSEMAEAKPAEQADPPLESQPPQSGNQPTEPHTPQEEPKQPDLTTTEIPNDSKAPLAREDIAEPENPILLEEKTGVIKVEEGTKAVEEDEKSIPIIDTPGQTDSGQLAGTQPAETSPNNTEPKLPAQSSGETAEVESPAIQEVPAPVVEPSTELPTNTTVQPSELPVVPDESVEKTTSDTNFEEPPNPTPQATADEAQQQRVCDEHRDNQPNSRSVQPAETHAPLPADTKTPQTTTPTKTEEVSNPEPAGNAQPGSEEKAPAPKQPKDGEDAQKPAPSPKKAKASKATKEDYLAVKGILDKWKQKVVKAETSKKGKLTLLQESLAKTQDLQRKLAQETRSRDADKAAKEAILGQMEAEHGAFLKQLDALKKQTPVAAIKESVFKKQVECRKEELQRKLEELKPAQNPFAERLRLQTELGQQHKEQLRLTREIEKHTSLITVLEHKEKDALERLKVSGTDYEAEKQRVEVAIARDSEQTSVLEAEDMKVLHSIEEAVERAKNLETEIQAIRREEFECREKFEVDNRFNKEECARLRAQLLSREDKNEELKQENTVLAQKCEELGHEITKTVATIKQMHAASKTQVSTSNTNLKLEKSQREALEKLLHEKNELKAEIDRLSREKGKLTVIVKDLGEVRALRESNLSLLIEFLASLDHTDRMSVEKEMTTNLNPKSLDIKRLVKSTVGRNIELKYELERLERECAQIGVDCADH